VRVGAGVAFALPLLAAGCGGPQHALAPAGEHAARVAVLWWAMLGVGTLVFLVVTALAAGALWRRPPAAEEDREAGDRRRARHIAAGVVATVLVLLGVLVGSLWTGTTRTGVRGEPAVVIEVTGKQWWWHVRYDDPVPERQVITANELHIPVGRVVELRLRTDDVIHSFWVPRLAGKTDMVPGRTNRLRLRATEAGVFRGQCAEFCGLQHAHMGLLVVATGEDEWERWMESQRRPATPPADSARRHGERVFLESSCALCHAVRGTRALASAGPDLTHLASRRTIAAATRPNTRGALGGWIVDPHAIKPGNLMPPTDLSAEDLRALLDYLEGLR
jgi:cytochrome c oxidase subunit II